MIKDPDAVARFAAEREDEHWRFRTYLKLLPPRAAARADRLAHELGRAAQAEMDCTACGACCRDNCVQVGPEDRARLARRLGLSAEEFDRRFLTTDDDGEPAVDARPCPFLLGNTCSVYEDRPEACRGYPYLESRASTHLVGIIERAGVCPIVCEMLEQLKAAVGFRRWSPSAGGGEAAGEHPPPR